LFQMTNVTAKNYACETCVFCETIYNYVYHFGWLSLAFLIFFSK
jgi:hypothetical protein